MFFGGGLGGLLLWLLCVKGGTQGFWCVCLFFLVYITKYIKMFGVGWGGVLGVGVLGVCVFLWGFGYSFTCFISTSHVSKKIIFFFLVFF